MVPKLLIGAVHQDVRGSLFHNNDFDASRIKRIYTIENKNTSIVRRWQGHKFEQRWFSAVLGRFKILLIRIDDWDEPNRARQPEEYILCSDRLDVLHIPNGYVSSLQALDECSKLLVMADYSLGEVKDEYRFPHDYFENVK